MELNRSVDIGGRVKKFTHSIIISALVLSVVLALGCGMAGDPILDSLYSRDIYPGTTLAYDIGSEDYEYDSIYSATGYFDSVILSGSALSVIIYKAGSTTTDGNGDGSVTFATAFSDTDYVIVLTCESPADTTVVMYVNKAAGSFGIKTEDDQGNNEGNVDVDWFCIGYNDP